MVEGMSVVVNVMLSLSNECYEPTSCLVQPIGTHGGDVMYFGSVFFRSELGFLNCDDICMRVVNKQFSSSSLFLIPFMLTCSMMRLISHLLLCLLVLCLWSCGRIWSVCEVVVVPYVDECSECGWSRGSDIVYSAADVLWMRGVSGVCAIFMYLARGGVGVEWMRGLGFTNPVGTGRVLDVCLCLDCGGVGGVNGEWLGRLDQGLERWHGVMSV